MLRHTMRPALRGERTSPRRNRALAAATAALLAVTGLSVGVAPASAFQGHSTATLDDATTATSTYAGGLTMTTTVQPVGDATTTLTTPVMTQSTTGSTFTPADVLVNRPIVRLASKLSSIETDRYIEYANVTFTFSRPVTNPALHVARMFAAVGGDEGSITATPRFTVTGGSPTAPTLTKLSGFDGWTVTNDSFFADTTPISYSNPDVCTRNPVHLDASPAGCGSVQITGTVESVTFRLESIRGSWGTGNSTIAGPNINMEMTVDEDLAGGTTALPSTYGAASHINSGLALGDGLTNDATSVRTADAPQEQAVDANDLFDENPTLYTGRANTLSLPVTGLLPGHTATTSVWVDSNMNGVFDSNEVYTTTGGNGIHAVTIPSSALPTTGDSWMRVRTSENAAQATSATGFADSGEVEDWPVTIVTVAPANPVVTAPDDGALLNTARPTFAGTGETPGQTVEVRTSTGEVVCTTTVAADLSFLCTPSIALPEGTADYTVVEIDDNGVASDPGTTLTLTINTAVPEAPVVSPSAGDVLTGTATPGDTITATLPDGTRLTGVVDGAGRWSIEVPEKTVLVPGDRVSVTATNPAGTVSAPVLLIIQAEAADPSGNGSGSGSSGTTQTGTAGLAQTGDTLSLPTGAAAVAALLVGAGLLVARRRSAA